MREFGEEELVCPAQSPELNLTEQLWGELERDCKPGLLVQHQCLTSQMHF